MRLTLVVELDGESMRRVVPSALHGRGRLVALCGLNKTNLVEMVVKPVLELVQSVPLKNAYRRLPMLERSARRAGR